MYPTEALLRSHIKESHLVEEVPCDVCGKVYANSSKLQGRGIFCSKNLCLFRKFQDFLNKRKLKVIVEMVFPFVKNRDFPLEFFPFYIKKVVKLLVWIYSMITKYPIIVKY